MFDNKRANNQHYDTCSCDISKRNVSHSCEVSQLQPPRERSKLRKENWNFEISNYSDKFGHRIILLNNIAMKALKRFGVLISQGLQNY